MVFLSSTDSQSNAFSSWGRGGSRLMHHNLMPSLSCSFPFIWKQILCLSLLSEFILASVNNIDCSDLSISLMCQGPL